MSRVLSTLMLEAGVTILNLTIIFRGEPRKEIFTDRFNLLLTKWKNKEEMMMTTSKFVPQSWPGHNR